MELEKVQRKIIDLTQEIYTNMEVYQDDPEVEIQKIQDISTHGWNLSLLKMGSHTGTHVDAFYHMDEKGETLENIELSRFIGRAILVDKNTAYPKKLGLIFDEYLDIRDFDKIKEVNPNFVATREISEELEEKLLKEKIITYTGLVNLELLPKNEEFLFIGLPLKIREGDGSPVRAVAVLD